ncbi:MAG: HAMP domain-containing histidine kinase [Clostridia bacterium]|nr:HAMP domain-containing histidine kinase [Clostridia bacterium]
MDLLRKQRAKFTAVTTSIAAILLLVILGVLFLMIFETTNMSASNALDKALYSRNNYTEIPQQSTRAFYVFLSASGQTIVKDDLSYYDNNVDEIVSKASEVKQGRFKVGDYYFICDNIENANGTLIAVIDRSDYHELIINTGVLLALLYALFTTIVASLAYIISAKILRPVAKSFEKQRELVANASHELKTPLTVIATNLNVIKSEPASTVAENAEWIEYIDAHILRMKNLIQNMLELSKLEQSELPKEELDISIACEGACLTFEATCFEKNVRLITNIQKSITVYGDKNALDRLIVILLDNAVKYCNPGGKVGVKLSADQKKVRLSVINTGVTISADEAEHVFDRFYRADTARKNEDKQSFGLGLSIAATTVKAHDGTISCQGVDGKGTIFRVSLPIGKPKKTKTKKFTKKKNNKEEK